MQTCSYLVEDDSASQKVKASMPAPMLSRGLLAAQSVGLPSAHSAYSMPLTNVSGQYNEPGNNI